MPDISILAGGRPNTSGTTPSPATMPQVVRGRVVVAPPSTSDPLRVVVSNFSDTHDYEVPATQWASTRPDLPQVGDYCVMLFDDDGDVWVTLYEGIGGGGGGGGTVGPPGPAGPAGPPGPAGPTGGTYTHTQGSPAATWNVVHNLGFRPNVAAVDSTDREFIADVTYVDNNSLTIALTAATAGKAYLS